MALALTASGSAVANILTSEKEPPSGSHLAESEPYSRLSAQPRATPPSAPDPPDLTLAGYAYESVASQLPGVRPEDVGHVRQSVLEPSWASVWIKAPDRDEDDYYAIFLRKADDEWLAEKSVLIEDQEHPKNVKTLLKDVPVDLVNYIYPPRKNGRPAKKPAERAVRLVERATEEDGWAAETSRSIGSLHEVRVENEKADDLHTTVYLTGEDKELDVVAVGRDLTSAEVPGFPPELVEPAIMAAPDRPEYAPAEPVFDGDVERDRVQRGVEEAVNKVRDYPGVAGFYVRDLKTGSGYGVRPDEVFFSASTIKLPVMVAVYRRIDEGKLSYRDVFETREEDWAAGAGWLQWNTPGAKTTVEDSLWLMITQSDNVATNALVRLVGGPDYVNEVARSLGARHTTLYWKLSSERAAVPDLDNRTTPRDMANMLAEIKAGRAASDFACQEMLDLLRQNNLEYWVEAGVPEGVPVANKAGWLDTTYNDVGVIEYDERPYVLAVFTKYGPQKSGPGAAPLASTSRAAWLAQSGTTVEQYEKKQKEKERKQREKQKREEQKRDQEEPVENP